MTAIGGFVAPGFEALREEFERNFAERGDVGAAVAVIVDGVPVADLWGGWRDEARTQPWNRDTIVNVWSAGKPVAALALLRLVDRGLVDLDAPVAKYWPEFAQAGKAEVRVRTVLAHRAGLVAVRKPLPPGFNITNWDGMCEALAEQEPWWEPGTAFGYHTNTFGFLVGEIVRRVDGRSIGTFIREEIAEPLDAGDFMVGFGPEHDERVAEWIPYRRPEGEASERPWLEQNEEDLEGMALGRFLAYRNPPGGSGEGVNSRAWRAAEFPSTNPHANARALAHVYAALARGGTLHDYELLRPTTIERLRQIESDGEDLVLGRPNRFGLGFQLTIPGVRKLGNGPHNFGHFGNGAILGFADPDARMGFAYVCNRAGRSWRDPRNIALVDAAYAAL